MGGEIAAETMTRKKKKKGRPSLLELQKRSLKQQQQQQQQLQQQQKKNPNQINPNFPINSSRRSTRRNPNLDGGSPVADWIAGGDDDDDERQQKKHKLLLGLNSSRNNQHYPISSAPNSASCGSDSNADGEDPEASIKRRKLTALRPGSDQMVINHTHTYIFLGLQLILYFFKEQKQKPKTFSLFVWIFIFLFIYWNSTLDFARELNFYDWIGDEWRSLTKSRTFFFLQWLDIYLFSFTFLILGKSWNCAEHCFSFFVS